MRPLALCSALLLSAIGALAQSSSDGIPAPRDQNAKPELVMESGHLKVAFLDYIEKEILRNELTYVSCFQ